MDCPEVEIVAGVGDAVAVAEGTVGREVGLAVGGREVTVGADVAVASWEVAEGAAVAGAAADVAGPEVAWGKAIGLGAAVGSDAGGGAAHDTTSAPSTIKAIQDQFDRHFILYLHL
ncbi:MAG: hypothetical protein M1132_00205 [Chloroflexi bacterium]|nr:hypothetical protein [Chloroflexota bacterium]